MLFTLILKNPKPFFNKNFSSCLYPLISLSTLDHSCCEKTIHPIFGGKGFEISVMDQGMASFWKDFLYSIQLKFRMFIQKPLHHIFILLMENRAGAINEDTSHLHIG
jgi:hypothetical protein